MPHTSLPTVVSEAQSAAKAGVSLFHSPNYYVCWDNQYFDHCTREWVFRFGNNGDDDDEEKPTNQGARWKYASHQALHGYLWLDHVGANMRILERSSKLSLSIPNSDKRERELGCDSALSLPFMADLMWHHSVFSTIQSVLWYQSH